MSALLVVSSWGVLAAAGSPASATFPGDNGLIVFNRGGDLYTATAAGGSVKRITTSGGISGATWSPDGQELAFRRNGRIFVRTLATGATRVVADGVDSGPQWSPDGRRIAFVAELPGAPCGEQGVFSVPSAGGGAPRLDFDPESDNCPHAAEVFALGSYLPGGSSILLTTCYGWWDESCRIDEVGMDPNAAPWERNIVEVRCAMESETPEDGSPSRCSFDLHLSDARLSPAGDELLFSGRGGYEPPGGTLPGSTPLPTSSTPEKVYSVDVSGADLHRVGSTSRGHNPTWAPDGSAVLFTRDVDGVNRLMRVAGDSPTAKPTVLLRNASQADWQPVP